MHLSRRAARTSLVAVATAALAASVAVGVSSPAVAFTPDVKPRASTIALGGTHSLVLTPDGRVYGSGDTSFDQLPGQRVTPEPQNRTTLSLLSALPAGAKARAVAAGQIHSLVLGDNGVVYGAGGNFSFQLGADLSQVVNWKALTAGLPDGTSVARVSAGVSSTFVTTTSGDLYGMGGNASGELTDAVATHTEFVRMVLPSGVTARQVDSNGFYDGSKYRSFTIVLGSDNVLYGTGDNTYGQLTGAAAKKSALTPLTGVPAGTITGIAAGGASTYLVIGGTIYAVGRNAEGQLGRGTTSAMETNVAAMTGTANTGVLGIDGGTKHLVAFTAQGAIGVGEAGEGQLAKGATTFTDSTSLTPLTSAAGVTAGTPVEVSADSTNTLLRTADGVVLGTGGNFEGQLTGATPNMYPQIISLTGQLMIPYGVPSVDGARVGAPVEAGIERVWSVRPTVPQYRWFVNGSLTALGETYTPSASDLGKPLRVEVRGTRAGYSATAYIPSNTVTILPGRFSGGQVTVSGTPGVGRRLSAVAPTLSPAPSSSSFQWFRSGVPIPGATGSTYAQTVADAGRALSVVYAASLASYDPYTSTAATSVVPLHAVKAPRIKGTAKVGKTLKIRSRGSWAPAPTSYRYQWLRNGTTIKKATKTSYRLTKKDKGKRITVRVTARRSGVPSTSAVSARTGKVKG